MFISLRRNKYNILLSVIQVDKTAQRIKIITIFSPNAQPRKFPPYYRVGVFGRYLDDTNYLLCLKI